MQEKRSDLLSFVSRIAFRNNIFWIMTLCLLMSVPAIIQVSRVVPEAPYLLESELHFKEWHAGGDFQLISLDTSRFHILNSNPKNVFAADFSLKYIPAGKTLSAYIFDENLKRYLPVYNSSNVIDSISIKNAEWLNLLSIQDIRIEITNCTAFIMGNISGTTFLHFLVANQPQRYDLKFRTGHNRLLIDLFSQNGDVYLESENGTRHIELANSWMRLETEFNVGDEYLPHMRIVGKESGPFCVSEVWSELAINLRGQVDAEQAFGELAVNKIGRFLRNDNVTLVSRTVPFAIDLSPYRLHIKGYKIDEIRPTELFRIGVLDLPFPSTIAYVVMAISLWSVVLKRPIVLRKASVSGLEIGFERDLRAIERFQSHKFLQMLGVCAFFALLYAYSWSVLWIFLPAAADIVTQIFWLIIYLTVIVFVLTLGRFLIPSNRRSKSAKAYVAYSIMLALILLMLALSPSVNVLSALLYQNELATSLVFNPAFEMVLGTILTLVISVGIEDLRRPKLEIRIVPVTDVQYQNRPAQQARFLALNLENKSPHGLVGWISRRSAMQCHGDITFHYLNSGQSVFGRAMPIRWSRLPEPVPLPIVGGSGGTFLLDPERFNVRPRVDVYPGEPETLNVAAKFDNDLECYGWSNENYLSNPLWRHPDWTLPEGRYIVKVVIRSAGEKCSGVFRLINGATRQDFYLESTLPEDPVPVGG